MSNAESGASRLGAKKESPSFWPGLLCKLFCKLCYRSFGLRAQLANKLSTAAPVNCSSGSPSILLAQRLQPADQGSTQQRFGHDQSDKTNHRQTPV